MPIADNSAARRRFRQISSLACFPFLGLGEHS